MFDTITEKLARARHRGASALRPRRGPPPPPLRGRAFPALLLGVALVATSAAAYRESPERITADPVTVTGDPAPQTGTVVAPRPEAEQPAPTIGAKLLELINPGTVGTGLGLVLSALGGLAFMSQRRKKLIALAAYHAFHIVEDIGNEIEGDDGFDKTASYLKQLDAFMVANGWRPLKPGETEAAKLTASALHGAEVAKAKVAAAAAVAAAEAAKGP